MSNQTLASEVEMIVLSDGKSLTAVLLLMVGAAALAAEPAQKEQGRPLLALLTQVEGEVRLAASDGSRGRPARLFQGVVEGDRLELAEGARVTLLCANAVVRRLEQTRPLDAELCRDETRERALTAGGLELNLGSLELIGEARGDGTDVARWLAQVEPPDPEQLRQALTTVASLGLDAQTDVLTRAAIYAGSGQLGEAAAVLEPAARVQDSPAIARLLASLKAGIEGAKLAGASQRVEPALADPLASALCQNLRKRLHRSLPPRIRAALEQCAQPAAGSHRAACHLLKGLELLESGSMELASAAFQEALAWYQRGNDDWGVWMAQSQIGITEFLHGDQVAAQARIQSALNSISESGNEQKPIPALTLRVFGEINDFPADAVNILIEYQPQTGQSLFTLAKTISNLLLSNIAACRGEIDTAKQYLGNVELQLQQVLTMVGGPAVTTTTTEVGSAGRSLMEHLWSIQSIARSAQMNSDAADMRLFHESSKQTYGLPETTESSLMLNSNALEAAATSSPQEAWLWFERAVLLARLGDMEGARHALGTARALARLSAIPLFEERIMLGLGLRFIELELFEDAAQILEETVYMLGEHPAAGLQQKVLEVTHVQLVLIYGKLGLHALADQHKEKLRELVKQSGNHEILQVAELLQATDVAEGFHMSADDLRRVIDAVSRSQSISGKSNDLPRDFADPQIQILLDMLEVIEREADPVKVGEYFFHQAQTQTSVPDLGGLLVLLSPMASQLAGGSPRKAFIELEKAMRNFSSHYRPSIFMEAKNQMTLAMLEVLMPNRQAKAVDRCTKAIELFEDYVNNMRVEEAMTGFLDAAAGQLYSMAVEILSRAGRTRDAFSHAERGRAWVLRRLLARPRRVLLNTAEPVVRDSIGQKTFEAERFRQKLLSANNAHLPVAPSVSLAELQSKLLPPQTTLLAYFPGFGPQGVPRLWVWVVDRKNVKSDSFPMTTEDWQALTCEVDALRWQSVPLAAMRAAGARGVQPLAQCKPAGDPSTALYRRLIAPVRRHLKNVQHLIVVPHGQLYYVPFAALRNAGTGRYLIQDFTLSVAPSASALALLSQRASVPAGTEAVVLGDPVTQLGPLQGAHQEASAVATLLGTEPLLGELATESHVLEKAGRIRLLHLAAHGQYENKNPIFSNLLLSADAENDGALEMHQVWDSLDLHGTELVVLSGCETALGKVTGGDEVLSLPHAFFVAGSRAVISTLWRVDDEASSRLMIAFYKQFTQNGLSVAEALRQAQLGMIEGSAAPYYWAGFMLNGDPNARWKQPPSGSQEPPSR